MNSTEDDSGFNPASPSAFPLIVAIYSSLFLTSEIGNGFVIYSLVYLKRHKRTAIDNYVLCLAVADFLLTNITLFYFSEYIQNKWTLGEVICKVFGQLMELTYAVSALTLATISYQRSKVANDVFKLLHAKRREKRNILVIWLVAFVVSSPVLFGYTVAKRNNRLYCNDTKSSKTARQIYSCLQAIPLFVLPILILIVSQKKIAKGLRRHTETQKAMMDCGNTSWTRMVARERRIRKLLTIAWVVFVCCYTPNIIFRIINNHFTTLRSTSELWNQIWQAGHLLVFLNSAINPFLYYRMMNKSPSNSGLISKLCCVFRWHKSSQLSASFHSQEIITESLSNQKDTTEIPEV